LGHFRAICEEICRSKNLHLNSVMGYEAQIGVPDNKPSNRVMNIILNTFKNLTFSDVCRKRAEITKYLQENKLDIEFFNGGGTGTITKTIKDKSVTEVAFGSGILHAHIFDKYKHKTTSCAFTFGLRVTRIPAPGVVTCQSGGFIASGPISKISAPTVLLPQGLMDDENEGFGEVQTPLYTNGAQLRIGDPVFFQPSKSGEIAERFNKYILVQNGKIIGEENTYRGHDEAFY